GARVRLDDVHRPPHQHLAEAPAGELALAACHRDRLATAHLLIGPEVVRDHRLLEPADVERCHGAAKGNGVDGIIAVIGIEHQPGPRADGLAHRPNERDVLLEPEPDLELYRTEAFTHVAR